MLTIYTTKKCKACVVLKGRFKKHDIRYEEKHVNFVPKKYKRLILGGVPLVFRDDKPLSDEEIEGLFK